MSSFLCSTLHTVVVAAAISRAGLSDADTVSIAMQLRDANNKALAARYGDEAEPLGAAAEAIVAAGNEHTDIQVNTMARCFAYQCSEGDVMETHPAAELLRKLIAATGGEEARMVDGFWGI